jgi:hypothetical protein
LNESDFFDKKCSVFFPTYTGDTNVSFDYPRLASFFGTDTNDEDTILRDTKVGELLSNIVSSNGACSN